MPQVCGIRNMAPWCRGVSASGSQAVPGRCRVRTHGADLHENNATKV